MRVDHLWRCRSRRHIPKREKRSHDPGKEPAFSRSIFESSFDDVKDPCLCQGMAFVSTNALGGVLGPKRETLLVVAAHDILDIGPQKSQQLQVMVRSKEAGITTTVILKQPHLFKCKM